MDSEYATTKILAHNWHLGENEWDQLCTQGKKHLDLWSLEPPFKNMHDLARFIGDEKEGLLGYCEKL